MRDVLVDETDAELGAAMTAVLEHPTTLLGELRELGGAVADVPPDATAWAGRHQQVLAATWTHVFYEERDVAVEDVERFAAPSRQPNSAGIYDQTIDVLNVYTQYAF